VTTPREPSALNPQSLSETATIPPVVPSESETLIPRLKIADRCTLAERFLIVRGSVRTWTIHLGSGNILMEPNDQYLCIVPKQTIAGGERVHLPFEGDGTLSIILSKAFLLADDAKIMDPTILSQLKR
jgi:hypothetical protein